MKEFELTILDVIVKLRDGKEKRSRWTFFEAVKEGNRKEVAER